MASFQEQLEQFVEGFEEMQRCPDSEDMFNEEFMALKAQSQQLKDQEEYATDSGQLPVNKKKNRFKDILPFEYTRVKLPVINGVEGSDYINANYIKGCDGKTSYIAAQGPLPNTVNDFVRMLWQNNTEIIIMACREVEMGKHKCHPYWAELNEETVFGDIAVQTTNEENVSNDFVIRDLVVKCGSEEKFMKQYHYTAWPDHGVPTSAEPIIRMIEMARECQKRVDIPVVVHCSAGCGRTGTILAVDYMRSMLLTKSLPKDFTVYGLVEQMRAQRPAMVQAKDQYFFVYMACAELAKRVLGNKPQPPPKNGDTISGLKKRVEPVQASGSQDDSIYENTVSGDTSDTSPPTIPRQNSNKSSTQPPVTPPKPRSSKNQTSAAPSTPSSSSNSLSTQASNTPTSTGVYEVVVAPDSPVPKAAPRLKKTVTPQSLQVDKAADEGKKPTLPERSVDVAPPKSPTVGPKPGIRRETSKAEEKVPPVPKSKSTPKMEPKVDETPKSTGKSILDTIMDICGTDVQAEAGVNKEEDGVGTDKPISFDVDSVDAPPVLPSRTTDSMEVILPTPPTPTSTVTSDSKQRPPLPVPAPNGIYEQPTLFSVPVANKMPPPIPSGPSPPSTLSPSSSINALGGPRSSTIQPSAALTQKSSTARSKGAERESDISEAVKSPRIDSRFPAVPNMSASGSGVSVPSGPLGFGVRIGKPRGPRPPPAHWKTVQPVV